MFEKITLSPRHCLSSIFLHRLKFLTDKYSSILLNSVYWRTGTIFYCYHSHFKDGEIKALRKKVTCPRSQNCYMGKIRHQLWPSLLFVQFCINVLKKCTKNPNQNLLNSNHVLKDGVFSLHKRFSALQQGALPWCVRRKKKIHFLYQPVICPLWLNHIPLDNHKQWQELLLCSDSHVWIGLLNWFAEMLHSAALLENTTKNRCAGPRHSYHLAV